jgi:hypothetical protein
MRARNLVLVLALCAGFTLACGVDLSREQGVCLPDQVDEIAWGFIKDKGLLEDGEDLRAYYDNSVSLDGSDIAIVTDRHVLTHRNGTTSQIPLSEISSIERVDDVVGEAIEVGASGGRMVRVPIAPLNGIDTFEKVLRSARSVHE